MNQNNAESKEGKEHIRHESPKLSGKQLEFIERRKILKF